MFSSWFFSKNLEVDLVSRLGKLVYIFSDLGLFEPGLSVEKGPNQKIYKLICPVEKPGQLLQFLRFLKKTIVNIVFTRETRLNLGPAHFIFTILVILVKSLKVLTEKSTRITGFNRFHRVK